MVKWYHYLNKKGEQSLLKYEKINENNLVICQDTGIRTYTIFKDYLTFYSYREKINNCFYEIITENQLRKPYFDIDIDINKKDEINKNKDDIIKEINTAILSLVKDAIILIYSSHTNVKISFHVIIANYYFYNKDEGKNFYNKVVELIKEEYRPYIDNSVYKSTQQFRILGSAKHNKQNTKIFREDLSVNLIIPKRYIKFPDGLKIYLLSISLVSITAGSKYLDGYKEDIKKDDIIYKGFSSEGDLEDVLDIFYSIYQRYIFEYQNIIENDGNLLITFKRLNPSFCEDCNRTHENENPFITVTGIYRAIYFHCRRKEEGGKGKLIGELGPEILPELSSDIKNKIVLINKEDSDSEEESIVNKMKILSTKKSKPKGKIVTDLLKI